MTGSRPPVTAARAAMLRGAVGEKVYFIGQPHDQDFFTHRWS